MSLYNMINWLARSESLYIFKKLIFCLFHVMFIIPFFLLALINSILMRSKRRSYQPNNGAPMIKILFSKEMFLWQPFAIYTTFHKEPCSNVTYHFSQIPSVLKLLCTLPQVIFQLIAFDGMADCFK